MGRQVAVVLYVVAMAAVIVGVDFVFFRNRFWERLTVNIGIVLVFAAFSGDSSGVHEQGAMAPFRCVLGLPMARLPYVWSPADEALEPRHAELRLQRPS